MTDKQICLYCDYFEATVLEEGQCRRYSPKLYQEHAMGKFPTVSNDWWCGEWWNQKWVDYQTKYRSDRSEGRLIVHD